MNYDNDNLPSWNPPHRPPHPIKTGECCLPGQDNMQGGVVRITWEEAHCECHVNGPGCWGFLFRSVSKNVGTPTIDCPPTNQPTNKPTNQPTQPTNQPLAGSRMHSEDSRPPSSPLPLLQGPLSPSAMTHRLLRFHFRSENLGSIPQRCDMAMWHNLFLHLGWMNIHLPPILTLSRGTGS